MVAVPPCGDTDTVLAEPLQSWAPEYAEPLRRCVAKAALSKPQCDGRDQCREFRNGRSSGPAVRLRSDRCRRSAEAWTWFAQLSGVSSNQ